MKKIILTLFTVALLNCNTTNAPSATETSEYNAAVALFNAASYASAQTAFSDFIATYPNSASLDGAYYYLGRSWFETARISKSSADYTTASGNFQTVIITGVEVMRPSVKST